MIQKQIDRIIAELDHDQDSCPICDKNINVEDTWRKQSWKTTIFVNWKFRNKLDKLGKSDREIYDICEPCYNQFASLTTIGDAQDRMIKLNIKKINNRDVNL